MLLLLSYYTIITIINYIRDRLCIFSRKAQKRQKLFINKKIQKCFKSFPTTIKNYQSALKSFFTFFKSFRNFHEPLSKSVLRDQSVFITWGGSEEFGGGVSLKIELPKGGGYSLEDFVEGGVQKIHTIQLNLQYIFLTLVNIILQRHDCIATKIQK